MTTITLQFSRRHRWYGYSVLAYLMGVDVDHVDIVLPPGIKLPLGFSSYLSRNGFSFIKADDFLGYIRVNGGLLGARTQAFGAPRAGVQLRRHDYARFDRVVRVEIPIRDRRNDDPGEWPYTWAWSQIGKPYDYRSVAAFFLPFLRWDWRSGKRWECCAFGTRWIEVVGAVPRLYIPVTRITVEGSAAAASAIAGSRWKIVT